MAVPALYLELRAARKTTRVARRNDMNNRPYTGLSNITSANLIKSKENVVSHIARHYGQGGVEEQVPLFLPSSLVER
jgi:hypothetical protein